MLNPRVPVVIDIIFPVAAFTALDASQAFARFDALDILSLLVAKLPLDWARLSLFWHLVYCGKVPVPKCSTLVQGPIGGQKFSVFPRTRWAGKKRRSGGTCVFYGWTPGIGDPTIYGWVTVAAYALGTYACWLASTCSPLRERNIWRALTLVMAFLCINKQLDLQELFGFFARFEARKHGWYDARRPYQLAFIFALAIGSILSVVALLARTREASGSVRGAIVGLAVLLLFVLVRATSFHKVDLFINLHLAGMRANHVLEIGGIAIVTGFAFSATRKRRRLRGKAHRRRAGRLY